MKVSQIDWSSWTPTHKATLVFVFREKEVLLIRKKRGLGEGKINAPGGKVDPGETWEETAIREMDEEVCLRVSNIEFVGEHFYQFVDGYSMHVHVYRTDQYTGTPTETEEAIPMWFSIDELPYDEMWEDDRIWVPLMLDRIPFSAWYVFDQSKMIDVVIKEHPR